MNSIRRISTKSHGCKKDEWVFARCYLKNIKPDLNFGGTAWVQQLLSIFLSKYISIFFKNESFTRLQGMEKFLKWRMKLHVRADITRKKSTPLGSEFKMFVFIVYALRLYWQRYNRGVDQHPMLINVQMIHWSEYADSSIYWHSEPMGTTHFRYHTYWSQRQHNVLLIVNTVLCGSQEHSLGMFVEKMFHLTIGASKSVRREPCGYLAAAEVNKAGDQLQSYSNWLYFLELGI